MTEPQLRNIALLIDADNISPQTIDPVLTVMAELGQVNIRRAYGNFAKGNLQSWGDITNRLGIRPHQQFDLTKGKNATDMALTIDAMDLLYQGKVDGFGLMTSDSDFTPLVSRLRQDGIVVYGFGRATTPPAFQAACTRFIDVEALLKTGREPDPAPVAATSADAADTAQPAVDEELVELLGNAWKGAKRDENGWASLSQVAQIAGNRSSFDVRNYGFTRLTDLLASLDQFRIERRGENKTAFIKRVR